MGDQRLDWAEATKDLVVPRSFKPKKQLWEEIAITPVCHEEVVLQIRHQDTKDQNNQSA